MNILSYIKKVFCHKVISSVNPYPLSLILILIALCILSGCKDDVDISGNTEKTQSEDDGDCIEFTIQLDKLTSTRADDIKLPDSFTDGSSMVDKFDNYIDTQDKFRVFFFNEDGDFLFGATDRVVGSLESHDNASNFWYVRIPMTMIVDRENQEYDIDKIKNYLKTHKFKIAVLANWPNAGEKINPADYDDSEGSADISENPSSVLKGNPHWNWSNSILNQYATDVRNINDLHHIYNDLYYAASSRVTYYSQFMADAKPGDDQGKYLGEPTDWVEMRNVEESGAWKANYPLNDRVKDQKGDSYKVASIDGTNSSFDSKETANQWIRANWTPDWEMNENKQIYRHYQHMWYLWNFDASYKYGLYKTNPAGNNAIAYSKAYEDNWGMNDATAKQPVTWIVNPWGPEWYDRNGKDIYKWMQQSMTTDWKGEVTYKDLGRLTTLATETAEGNQQNVLTFTPISGAHMVSTTNGYGIYLPQNGYTEKVDDNTIGCFRFRARTAGTIRVCWSSATNSTATLQIQKDTKTGSEVSNKKYNTSSTAPRVDEWDVSVGADAFPMYIYCSSGNIIIYSIEYIRGKYLYDTDREGRLPNESQAIPMYGVQLYDAIPNWQRGTTINISEGENGKTVYLIRALAKIEVFIKSEFGDLRHVYMKSMNRVARCEPMDVETPTHDLWEENHYDENASTDEEKKKCEWYRVQKYGPAFKISQDYKNWLGWFYESWEKTKWQTGGYRWNYDTELQTPLNKHKGWSLSYKSGSSIKPPQIYNPYINRSDFCRFIYAGKSGEYDRFVLYMPEKNIDDPNTVGDVTTTPKVPHIEYRFYPSSISHKGYSNSEFNLDDNDCYRIYFTNYGFSSSNGKNLGGTEVNPKLSKKSVTSQQYDNYEKDHDNLSYHWPIMRNHIYQFFVGGAGPESPTIEVKVADWSHEKVVIDW